jgi:hypothetical protein
MPVYLVVSPEVDADGMIRVVTQPCRSVKEVVSYIEQHPDRPNQILPVCRWLRSDECDDLIDAIATLVPQGPWDARRWVEDRLNDHATEEKHDAATT